MDRRVLRRIVETADLSDDDVVVEVGPGRGILTRALADRASRVVAVEIDEAAAAALGAELADQPHVTVLAADAREVDVDSLAPAGMPYKMVANLPYYAASPIIRRFLVASRKPQTMVVMVQREVARTMVARPGKMGLLSIAVQIYGSPRIVGYAPPRAFRPAPKVTSAIVRIDVYPRPVVVFDSEEHFFTMARAGFSAPRKQIRNSLANGLRVSAQAAEATLSKARLDPRRRPQTLSLPEWGELYRVFSQEFPAERLGSG